MSILKQRSAQRARREERDLNALLLNSSSTEKRLWAADLLCDRGAPPPNLLHLLKRERNELVLCSLIELSEQLEESDSLIFALRAFAEESRSTLVRCFALQALWNVAGQRSIPFLLGRSKAETRRRARAVAHVLCFFGRVEESWPEVQKALQSGDYLVRVRTANMIAYEQPAYLREAVIITLKRSLAAEPPIAVREAFERCLSVLTAAQTKQGMRPVPQRRRS